MYSRVRKCILSKDEPKVVVSALFNNNTELMFKCVLLQCRLVPHDKCFHEWF